LFTEKGQPFHYIIKVPLFVYSILVILQIFFLFKKIFFLVVLFRVYFHTINWIKISTHIPPRWGSVRSNESSLGRDCGLKLVWSLFCRIWGLSVLRWSRLPWRCKISLIRSPFTSLLEIYIRLHYLKCVLPFYIF
jgi:hypothetical protein